MTKGDVFGQGLDALACTRGLTRRDQWGARERWATIGGMMPQRSHAQNGSSDRTTRSYNRRPILPTDARVEGVVHHAEGDIS
jgi:hypothetical protein